jgi:prolyl oligopeptidase
VARWAVRSVVVAFRVVAKSSSRTRFGVLLGSIALMAACATPLSPPTAARLSYPAAARDDVVDDYHGTRVADPYRWLEARDSAPTQTWIAAQNRLSQPWLEQLPRRERIRQQLDARIRYERFGVPVTEGGRFFFTHNSGHQDQDVLYVSADLEAAPRVLLDPNTLSRDRTVSLADFVPDRQGRRVAYALSDGGTDWKSWHVRDVDTGHDLPDIIHFTKFTSVSWTLDGSGFYYSRYPLRADGTGDDQRQAVIYFHPLGQPQSEDRLIYAVTDHPTRVPYGTVTEDGRYLVISLDDGSLRSGVSTLALADGGNGVAPGAAVTALLAAWDGLYEFIGSDGDELYFTTTAQAPRGRVIAVPVLRPEPKAPGASHEIASEREDALLQATYVGGRFIVVYLHDAHGLARLIDGTTVRDIVLPGLGTVAGFGGHRNDRETFFSYTDFTTPPRVFRLDLAAATSLTVTPTPVWTPKTAGAAEELVTRTDFVTEQVFYTSRDGTRVPMFLVHRRDLKRDGNVPVMLYGYGGFDISLTPAYSATALTWLSMGGMYAVANLRGGGEYGEAWHEAGLGLHKQNVFDDFIAAAEYLISEGYTRPSRLAISGRSNGGLLVGAVLTQRPDLFGAALPAVGVLDMLRYQTASANARQWSSDYGLSNNPTDFTAQYAYSPYQNVRAGTCYPPTLITTADHDDRVAPWHSFKFAAALQAAQGCAHPVLIRIETRAGHGAGKPLSMQIDDYADQWAFAAQALGMRLKARKLQGYNGYQEP